MGLSRCKWSLASVLFQFNDFLIRVGNYHRSYTCSATATDCNCNCRYNSSQLLWHQQLMSSRTCVHTLSSLHNLKCLVYAIYYVGAVCKCVCINLAVSNLFAETFINARWLVRAGSSKMRIFESVFAVHIHVYVFMYVFMRGFEIAIVGWTKLVFWAYLFLSTFWSSFNIRFSFGWLQNGILFVILLRWNKFYGSFFIYMYDDTVIFFI